MSINTNGFITKYIESCAKDCKLEKEIKSIEERLIKPYEEIENIKVMYSVGPLEAKKKELIIHRKDINNYKEYYWYRSIVDGLYNLFEEYGWKYSTDTFVFLRDKYHINYEMDEGFRMFYLDSIRGISPTTTLGKNIRSEDIFDVYYEDYDGNWFKIPDNVDINECLTTVRDLLKELTDKDLEKLESEEYMMYLRLKEKYEGKSE